MLSSWIFSPLECGAMSMNYSPVTNLFAVKLIAVPKILRDSRISCKALSRGLGDEHFYSPRLKLRTFALTPAVDRRKINNNVSSRGGSRYFLNPESIVSVFRKKLLLSGQRPSTLPTMARLLAIAAVLLPLVQAGNWDPCSQMPYATLTTYEPAKQWCSLSNHPTSPNVHCRRGDFLCTLFANLEADAARVLW
jgi:hypothetical protein